MPVYIGKKWKFGRVTVTLMPDIPQTTKDSATQLVYSIKFKLSHAILSKNEITDIYIVT